jgi:amidase
VAGSCGPHLSSVIDRPAPSPRNRSRCRTAPARSGERALEIFWNDLRFISAINVLGLPSAVVPVALLQGKPIGVQLITGRYREDLALDAAAAIEKRAGMLVRQLWDRMGWAAAGICQPPRSA